MVRDMILFLELFLQGDFCWVFCDDSCWSWR